MYWTWASSVRPATSWATLPGSVAGRAVRGQGSCFGGQRDSGLSGGADRSRHDGRWHSGRLCSTPLAWTGGADNAHQGSAAVITPFLRFRVPAVSRRQCAGWYRGDLHTHTVHSDGRRRIDEMAEAATSAGLDFIVSTDHNTTFRESRAWASSSRRPRGHRQVRRSPPATATGWRLGSRQKAGSDWRYAPRDGAFAGYAAGGSLQMAAWWWPPPVGPAARLRLGVRLPGRGRHGSLERTVERR